MKRLWGNKKVRRFVQCGKMPLPYFVPKVQAQPLHKEVNRMGLRSLIRTVTTKSKALALLLLSLFSVMATSAFADNMGEPTDKGLGLQPKATELAHHAANFHDKLLLPIITVICLFVLALLVWIVIRYNKRTNPVPAKFSHNTLIEIIWTVVPVLILVVIGINSLKLLKDYHSPPPADVVVKVTGNQWYWTYDFPELGVTDVESRLLPEAADLQTARAKKLKYLLDVDNRLIVPVGQVVHLQITATDVIHAFAMPAFAIKADAVPGRLNEAWFKAEKTGVFYGQCSELCGKDHAYMPIVIEVVTPGEFDAYIVKSGGKTKALIAAEAAQAASVAAVPAEAAAVPAAAEVKPATAPAAKPAVATAKAPPATSSAASPEAPAAH